MFRILVVDDDPEICQWLSLGLASKRRDVHSLTSSKNLIQNAKTFHPHVVLLDLMLGSESGLDYIKSLQNAIPETSIIILTGYGTIERAVSALRLGADQFFTKPATLSEIEHYISGLESIHDKRLHPDFNKESALGESFLVCRSQAMFNISRLVDIAASSDISVLLLGETGVGKGLVARLLHETSERKEKPFMDVNCSSFARELIESELFGHEKGAFTGADRRKEGVWHAAGKGTLFLDEIGDLPLELQPKILKTLEEKVLRRVGGILMEPVHARVIAATNTRLYEKVKTGEFREDLFHRLNVFPIYIPPLRERLDDILPLTETFVRKVLKKYSRSTTDVAIKDEVLEKLLCYPWPGNVRELYYTVERALLVGQTSMLELEHLPDAIMHGTLTEAPASPHELLPGMPLKDVERVHILRTLEAARGNKKQAAKMLGITRDTLYRKLREYDAI